MKTPNTLCLPRSTVALVLGGVFCASQTLAQQAAPPPGYVYQVIAETKVGDGLFLTAEALKLPLLPPGFVFGIVPEATK